MPRPRKDQPSIPPYRKHKSSGQAVVMIAGRTIYLGRHGTKASREAYARAIAEWIARGRQPQAPPAAAGGDPAGDALTVAELADRYLSHADRYYVGNPARVRALEMVLAPLVKLYARTPAGEFGPLAMKAVRVAMTDRGWARTQINRNVSALRGVFKWAVSEELIPPAVHQALITVEPLRRGRCEAHESDPVAPVPLATVETTLPYLSPPVAALVRLQLYTGARPGELVVLRPIDVDTTGAVWAYRPAQHKGAWRSKPRSIFFGPKAQTVLKGFLARPVERFCFSPKEAEAWRHEQDRTARKTKVQPSQVARHERSLRRRHERPPGEVYDVDAYRRAIHRACDRAFPPPAELASDDRAKWRDEHRWSPHQLRHTAAKLIRKQYGLEAARALLGHSMGGLAVTELYGEFDEEKARDIVLHVG